MDTKKRLRSWLIKRGYTEGQAEARLKGLTPPFHQTGFYGSTLPKKRQWMEDYPLLANLYELKNQGRLRQESILPEWVEKQVKEILEMAKTQDPDWAKLVWSVYWFVKFSGYEVVALAVAKIRAKWHTGDSPKAFFKKLREQEEAATKRLEPIYNQDRTIYIEGYLHAQTREAKAWRRQLQFKSPFDDRDTTFNGPREEFYGLPLEDFEKDRKQLAFLLGGATNDRNLTWIGLTIPFIWPEDSNAFTEVPLANPRVSIATEGVTITLTSAFVTKDWLKSPLLWEQIKDAIETKFGFYEQIPSTRERIEYLERHLDIDESSAQVGKRFDKQVESGKVPFEDVVEMESAHREKRYRAKQHPLFRVLRRA